MTYFDKETWARIRAHEDTELDAPATPEAMAAFEAKHGVALPAAHREFLMTSNGGLVGYVKLFGVGRGDFLDLEGQTREMGAEIGKTAEGPVLPFACDWAGGYYCYDLRKPAAPEGYPVLYWDHEYSEEPDDLPMLWSEYAPDFVSFVTKVLEV
jgi:hypothetical protein